jgi:GH3 auxin-responsive promoter
MFLGNTDIAIGQMYRAATHVRHFYAALRNPAQYQERKLMEMIKANADTVFGRAHHFDKIDSVAKYQSLVPAAQYEDLQPYIDRLLAGEKNQLTTENPFMFATTSGTTAKPKFVPITEAHLRDYTHAFQIHNYHMIKDFPDAARGRFFIITSNDELGITPGGLPYGAVSGLLNRRQSPIIRRHFALPYELCKIKEVDTKYYLMLRIAMAQDVTGILCCNPSSLLLLGDQLREHAPDLVSDLYDGTVKRRYTPPSHLASALAPYLKPQREKAKLIEAVLAEHGTITPKLLWPRLSALSCWKGGPMSFYLEKLGQFYGDTKIRDFGYMASEGRGSIPIHNAGAGGVLAVTSHFFEFVPEEDLDLPNPRFLLAHQLQKGCRYYIHFTTAAGLYRYNINDLMEVVGFEAQTPIIHFVRKGGGISSITGEKVTEEQVLVALTQATRQLNLAEMSHFTCEVELGMPPHYACFAELSENIADSVKDEFIRIFDHSLKMQNPEYQDKRETKRLGLPVLKTLPPGTYTRLRQQRVKEGAPEAQVKIPLLTSPNSFSGRLALLEV